VRALGWQEVEIINNDLGSVLSGSARVILQNSAAI
jgi:hypothetical protein